MRRNSPSCQCIAEAGIGNPAPGAAGAAPRDHRRGAIRPANPGATGQDRRADGEAEPIAEGSILPETYAFEWGDSRAALIRRAQAAMNAALAEAWRDRAPNLPIRSAREALILASIIERETGKADERALVASVFVNRLRRNMPLQSDPTVVYAALGGAALERAITR